ncbi:unnamed protein product [Polarella glacialis]|uniref:Uncharacterized protein n=1 Tax=Polarella glacialis TaxID=89957 RepID=A0A813E2R9_POLGL|nr:unnamed protein product [Polarella glacialis]
MIKDEVICASYGKSAPCVEQQIYTGKILYKGQHSGDNAKVTSNAGIGLHQMPSSDPVLLPHVELAMDIEATVKLVMRGSPQYWPSDEKLLRKVQGALFSVRKQRK